MCDSMEVEIVFEKVRDVFSPVIRSETQNGAVALFEVGTKYFETIYDVVFRFHEVD